MKTKVTNAVSGGWVAVGLSIAGSVPVTKSVSTICARIVCPQPVLLREPSAAVYLMDVAAFFPVVHVRLKRAASTTFVMHVFLQRVPMRGPNAVAFTMGAETFLTAVPVRLKRPASTTFVLACPRLAMNWVPSAVVSAMYAALSTTVVNV